MKKKISFILIGLIIGGFLGFAYYYFIGCKSGQCPIASNKYKMIALGMFLGGIAAFPSKK